MELALLSGIAICLCIGTAHAMVKVNGRRNNHESR